MSGIAWRRIAPRLWANGHNDRPYIQLIFDPYNSGVWKSLALDKAKMDATGPWRMDIIFNPATRGSWEIHAIDGEPDTYPNVAEAKAAAENWLARQSK